MQNLNNFRNLGSAVDEQHLLDKDIFNDDNLIPHYKNQRKSVRYVRKDIAVFVSQADIFGTHRLFSHSRALRVKLLDISSRGVLIGGSADLVLKMGQKIMLTLLFHSSKKFEIPAKVMRQITGEKGNYGIKFNQINDELGEYLVESQADLVFK